MCPSPNAAAGVLSTAPAEYRRAFLVYTDLDGTLLDGRTYRFDAARQALELLRARAIPVVLCSSKTRREIEVYRERLGNSEAFICENGGGIFIPKGRFPFAIEAEETGEYLVLPLGKPYRELRDALIEVRRELGVNVTGFGDMTAAQVAELTNLPIGDADLARRREFDEPFVFDDPEEPRATEFLRAIEAKGLRWTRGRFHHILGDSDKGRAADILTGIYRRERPELTTVGIGDSLNDLPLLVAVDIPVLVQREDGSYVDGVRSPRLVLADGAGPAGWNRAILQLLGT